MLKFFIFIGIITSIVGLIAAVARKKPENQAWLASRLGTDWETGFIGLWLGWRLVAVGAFLIYFEITQHGGVKMFAGTNIVGTLVIAFSLVVMAMHDMPSGRVWLEKKYGAGWDKKFVARFLQVPLFCVGLGMWIPNGWWSIIYKLCFGVIAAWVIFVMKDKGFFEKKKSTEADTAATPAGENMQQ